MRIFLGTLLIFSLIVPICAGQNTTQSETIDRISREFANGNVYEAEILALKALHADVSYSPQELFEIHKYLAFCYVAYGQRDKAVNEFLEVLRIYPNHRFDKQIYSPKIIEVFEFAQQEYDRLQKTEPPIENMSTYEIQIRAGKKSLLFPGLGQLYKGDTQKGYILIGAESLTICALIFTQLQYDSAHDDYLNETSASEIDSKYDRYDFYYKARNISAAAAAAIYLYGFLDSVYHPVGDDPAFSVNVSPVRVGFTLNF